MENSLKRRTLNALSWSFVQEGAVRGLQFGISVFLARILAPKEFGLVAMLSVFIGIAQALVDGGFASALIQGKQPSEEHKCSIFYFNIFSSILLAAVLWLAAPWIAGFYRQPLLASMLQVLALLPVINGFGIVQNAILMRQLAFKKQALILVASTGTSGILAIILAWHGFGVWSLVYQQLVQSVVRAALLWSLNTWRPKWLFSSKALREMFAFGWGMVCSGLLGSVFENYYPLLIGKFISASDLGFYNRAQSLQLNASQTLGVIVNRVTFPVFSSLQEDLDRFRRGLRKAMTTIAFVQFPLMIGLAVVSKPLVLLLLTEKWASSIPCLQLLAIAGVLYPIHLLNLNVVIALGRSDLFFRIQVWKLLIFLGIGVLTVRWGVMAMIWGTLGCDIVGYFLNSYYTKRLISYSVWDQLLDLYPYLMASTLMGLLVVLVGSLLPAGNVWQLSGRIAFGAIAYLAICASLRVRALSEVLSMLLPKETVPA